MGILPACLHPILHLLRLPQFARHAFLFRCLSLLPASILSISSPSSISALSTRILPACLHPSLHLLHLPQFASRAPPIFNLLPPFIIHLQPFLYRLPSHVHPFSLSSSFPSLPTPFTVRPPRPSIPPPRPPRPSLFYPSFPLVPRARSSLNSNFTPILAHTPPDSLTDGKLLTPFR